MFLEFSVELRLRDTKIN